MTSEEVRALPNGVYLVRWIDDMNRPSVAAVGRTANGRVWLAPSNWITVPSVDHWRDVFSVTLLALQHEGTPDDLIGMLLAALIDPKDFVALRALADCIGEHTGPPQAQLRLKPLEWNCIRTADHEDGEWWSVETVLGSITVEHDPGNGYRWRYCFDEYYDEGSYQCDSIAEGKQQAEAFYRDRISPFVES